MSELIFPHQDARSSGREAERHSFKATGAAPCYVVEAGPGQRARRMGAEQDWMG